MKYSSIDAFSIYGTIINISTFVQCCAYCIGQAAPPIISINYGAYKKIFINDGNYIFSVLTLFSLIFLKAYIYIFMKPTSEILRICRKIIRIYAISFTLLPFNIFSTYYF